MKDWEEAQRILANVVGGKVTPGSGNGRVKGDVVKEGLTFEVKQTEKKVFTLKKYDLRKLLNQAKNNLAVFVIFFELRGYAYVYSRISNNSAQCVPWKSKTLKEGNLPIEIYDEDSKWELISWAELKEL